MKRKRSDAGGSLANERGGAASREVKKKGQDQLHHVMSYVKKMCAYSPSFCPCLWLLDRWACFFLNSRQKRH